MSNETTPEKNYWAWGSERPLSEIAEDGSGFGQLAKDLISSLKTETELRRQNAALKEFVRNRLPDVAWSMNLPYAAYELGIMVKDVEHHGEVEALKFADWMLTDTAAMPAPSKAEVAREFTDEVTKRYFKFGKMSLVSYLLEILKEWEDAESK